MPEVTRQVRQPQVRKAQSSDSVIDRISEISFDDEGIKLALYGRSGTGKTTVWATFPKPILAILCSGGLKPGELRSVDTPEYRKTIKQVVLHETSEMVDLCHHVEQTRKYATVVLDHATGFQDSCLKEVLGLKEIPVQKSWGLASREQYGQVGVQVKEYLRLLLGLSVNVVIVAQERSFNEDGGGSDLILPSVGAGLSPSLCGWLNQAVDYIGQTYIRPKEKIVTMKAAGKVSIQKIPLPGEYEFCLRTAPDPVFMTKFRVPKGGQLPNSIVDPNYDKISGIIKGLQIK